MSYRLLMRWPAAMYVSLRRFRSIGKRIENDAPHPLIGRFLVEFGMPENIDADFGKGNRMFRIFKPERNCAFHCVTLGHGGNQTARRKNMAHRNEVRHRQ